MNSKENIYTRIVYSAVASDVVMTMVDGRVLMDDRQLFTVDIKEVLKHSNAAIKRLIARSGVNL